MEQLTEGIHYYFTKEGLLVMTEIYHRERGYCCGYGCAHCPFEYESVPEPRRSYFLQKQQVKDNQANA